jgi:hypothetical protein
MLPYGQNLSFDQVKQLLKNLQNNDAQPSQVMKEINPPSSSTTRCHVVPWVISKCIVLLWQRESVCAFEELIKLQS